MKQLSTSPSTSENESESSMKRNRALEPCDHYVVFSDLHVDVNRLDTCLQVLEYTHEVAAKNRAGIIFLGDFWHVRGSIPVVCLNRVLETVQKFTQPFLMIPGNHDQVTICGREHALLPVAAAMFPGLAHVVEHPTVLLDALWLPYRKRNQELVEALHVHGPYVKAVFCHAEIRGAWMNNHIRYEGHSGLEPKLFPNAPVPTYSGHFHRPHSVPGYAQIRYVGSPYQVSRAEEGQQKQLLILRSSDWQVEELVPLDIGPRFFSVSLAQARQRLQGSDQGIGTAAARQWRAGDRVTLLCSSSETLTTAQGPRDSRRELEQVYALLRQHGIQASMRVWDPEAGSVGERENAASPAFVGSRIRFPEAEQLEPPHVLRLYAQKHPQEVDKQTLELGLEILERVRQSKVVAAAAASRFSGALGQHRHVRLEFESICLHNFGCFRTTSPESRIEEEGTKDSLTVCRNGVSNESEALESDRSTPNGPSAIATAAKRNAAAAKTTLMACPDPPEVGVWYPLYRRGIVLVSGRNLDEDGCNSNGTGKTTLAMAALWALTGNLEPRRHLRRHVSQLRILHEDATDGFVELRARVNGKPLVVRRRVRRNGKQRARLSQELFVKYDSSDLTGLSLDDTQHQLDRILDPSLLLHAVFFGQSLMNDLLSATDKEFKEILDLVLPLQVWTEAYAQVTALQRAIGDEQQQLQMQKQNWQQELEREQVRLDQFRQAEQETQLEFDRQEQELKDSFQHQNRHSEVVAESGDNRDTSQLAALEETVRNLRTEIDADAIALTKLQQRQASLRAEQSQAKQRWDQWAQLEQLMTKSSRACNGITLEDTRDKLRKKLAALGRALQDLRLREERLQANMRLLDRLLHFQHPNDGSGEGREHPLVEQPAGATTPCCALCLQPVNAIAYEARLETLRNERNDLNEQLTSIIKDRQQMEAEVTISESLLEQTNAELAEQQALLERLHAVAELRPTAERLRELDLSCHRCTEEVAILTQALEDKRRLLRDHELSLHQQRQHLENEYWERQNAQDRALRQLAWIRQQRDRVMEPLVFAIQQAEERLANLRPALEQASARELFLEHRQELLRRLERAFHRGGIPSHLLDQSLHVIENLCRQYLQHLSDDTLLLRIRRRRLAQTVRTRQHPPRAPLSGPNLEVLVWQVFCRESTTGVFRERELGLLSGGQFRRVSLALSLAFAEYLCHQIGYSSSLLVLDEVLQQLDREGARRLATLLPQLERDTILVIAHENVRYLADVADAHDMVERSAGRSIVYCDVSLLEEATRGDAWSIDRFQ
jgi:DNA repair exonuclease SbcCD ATPase subunit